MVNTVERVSLIIGTAGHIDHGKTSLIKALTSIDTDRLKEEKRRGLTIDLGFAYIDFKDKGQVYRAAIVDVPGHERFIKNMLTGATGMDLVLFTVAADDGIMPQTIEHLEIIRLLEIKNVFFIITKCDLVDIKAVTAVEEEIKGLLKASPFAGAPVFRVSVKTGEGLPALTGALAEKVLSIKHGAGRGRRGREAQRYFRMPVDRSFTIKGFGTVVTGTVAGGSLKKGGTIIAYPSGESVKVRGLQSMHLFVPEVSAGERAAVNISGISKGEIKRGSCLMAIELAPFISMSPVVDCLFEFIESKDSAKKSKCDIRDRGLVKVHHHTGEALARIRFSGKKTVRPFEPVIGRLFLKRPLPMMRGDRFILRDSSANTTVGGGRVVFSYPSREPVPRFNRLASCHETGEGGVGCVGTAISMLLGPARPGIDLKTLFLLLNVREDNLQSCIMDKGLLNEKAFYITSGYLVSHYEAEAVKKTLKALLGRYHETHPLEDGPTAEDLAGLYAASRKERYAGGMRPLYRALAEELAAGGEVEVRGTRLCLKGHSPGLSKRESAIEGKIKEVLHARGLSLTKKEEFFPFAPSIKEIDVVISYMKKRGGLIALKQGAFIGEEALAKAREACFEYIRANNGITAGQCRDILGCGRKLAIMILEYFDMQGLTIRRGDLRTLR